MGALIFQIVEFILLSNILIAALAFDWQSGISIHIIKSVYRFFYGKQPFIGLHATQWETQDGDAVSPRFPGSPVRFLELKCHVE